MRQTDWIPSFVITRLKILPIETGFFGDPFFLFPAADVFFFEYFGLNKKIKKCFQSHPLDVAPPGLPHMPPKPLTVALQPTIYHQCLLSRKLKSTRLNQHYEKLRPSGNRAHYGDCFVSAFSRTEVSEGR